MARTVSAADQDRLLGLLADGRWHRGEDLAQGFGISRAAIAGRVQKLAERGVDVSSEPGRGYRLAAPLSLLDAEAIRAAAGDTACRIEVAGWIDSTNARLLAADPAGDPQALVAEAQSAGRGRLERPWQSPPGENIYLSLARGFEQWPQPVGCLPLAVGVAVWRVLRGLGLEQVRIKWPNDLWVDGRKLGGILIEQRGELGGRCRVVVGVGLNAGRAPAGLDEATGLAELLGEAAPARNRLAGELVRDIDAALTSFSASGFVPFAHDFERADLLRNQPVRVRFGERWQDGVAVGIRSDGALQLRGDEGLQAVHAGDVSVRPA